MLKYVLTALIIIGASAAQAEELTGVAECDSYVRQYEACLMSKVPAASATPMKASLDQFKQSLVAMSKNEATKAGMPDMCKQQMTIAKQSTGPMGCTYE